MDLEYIVFHNKYLRYKILEHTKIKDSRKYRDLIDINDITKYPLTLFYDKLKHDKRNLVGFNNIRIHQDYKPEVLKYVLSQKHTIIPNDDIYIYDKLELMKCLVKTKNYNDYDILLFDASEYGAVKIAKWLHKHAMITSIDNIYNLSIAARKDQVEILKLSKSLYPNMQPYHLPLAMALRHNSVNTLNWITENYPTVDTAIDINREDVDIFVDLYTANKSQNYYLRMFHTNFATFLYYFRLNKHTYVVLTSLFLFVVFCVILIAALLQ